MKNTILLTLSLLTLLVLGIRQPSIAQNNPPAWATACENAPAAEQFLCWINNARTDPAAMATFIQWKLDHDEAFKQWAIEAGQKDLLTAETLPMLHRDKTCPPPYPGREQPMKIIANNLKPLNFSDVLRDLGKLHFDIGMKVCPDGMGNQHISHCDINGNLDIDKVRCVSGNLAPSDLKACIYWGSAHATKASDFKIFQSFVTVLNGHSHIRPFFDIDGTNTDVGYFMDNDAHLIVLFSSKKPEKPADISIVCAQKAGLCPWNNLPTYVKQLPPPAKNTLTNVAQGKTASQSTLAHGGDAKRAVDGNTSGDWGQNSVTHTEEEASPWWQVDLGSSQTIYYVDIFNRTGYEFRLSNVKITISEQANFSPVTAEKSFPGQNLKAELNAVFNNCVQGRYVRIQLNNPEKFPLSLAEVKVWGK